MTRNYPKQSHSRTFYAAIYFAALALAAALFGVAALRASGAEYPVGTVLLSRNHDESQNRTPGYWNHLAMFVGNGEIVESQAGRGVVIAKLDDYLARPQSVKCIYPRDLAAGDKAAEFARSYVGRPYRWSSSITPNLSPTYGKNCVSPITEAYARAIDRQVRRCRRPDHILRYPQIFTNENPLNVPEPPPLEMK